MNNPPQDSAGQSQLDILIAEYISQLDDSVEVNVKEFLKPYPELADEFHAYLRNAELADVIATEQSQPEAEASQDTTPSMAVDETHATRPNRPEYDASRTLDSSHSVAAELDDRLPRPFGKYTLERLLGRGAMGCVYLAEDPELKRKIAIKIPKFSGDADSSTMLERFAREARSAAAIEHPNICPVYEVGQHEGQSFIAMMLVTGKPLGELIRGTNGLSPRVAINFIRKITLALA
ncbi:Serine/threonine-protein kinase PrkC [Rubripirellula amarantea]|uniref:Serine/threonine-protein kinase PrkC n=1 Tax=Rubripirellula amarantea TaxID=2527999 RepID=A0A5C5WKF5_9BACT|nr:Serine/threonine-protein kinase PrkC [Rubripirellula amarantea]